MTIIIFPFARQQDNIFEGRAGHQVWTSVTPQTGALSMAASYFFWWFLRQAFSVPLPSKVKVVVDFPHSISIKVLQKFLAWGTLIIVFLPHVTHLLHLLRPWGWGSLKLRLTGWIQHLKSALVNAIDTPCPQAAFFFFSCKLAQVQSLEPGVAGFLHEYAPFPVPAWGPLFHSLCQP